MLDYAEPVTKLIDELQKMPGVGAKSAQRLAFHILRAKRDVTNRLIDAIQDVKDKSIFCSVCNNITDVDPCLYCTSPGRDRRAILIVEEPYNLVTIEKTRECGALYHSFHGRLSHRPGVGV